MTERQFCTHTVYKLLSNISIDEKKSFLI